MKTIYIVVIAGVVLVGLYLSGIFGRTAKQAPSKTSSRPFVMPQRYPVYKEQNVSYQPPQRFPITNETYA